MYVDSTPKMVIRIGVSYIHHFMRTVCITAQYHNRKALYKCYGTVGFQEFLIPFPRLITFLWIMVWFLEFNLVHTEILSYCHCHAPLSLDLTSTFLNLASSRRNWHFNFSLFADEKFVSLKADQICLFKHQ